jgi:hypothetical protein
MRSVVNEYKGFTRISVQWTGEVLNLMLIDERSFEDEIAFKKFVTSSSLILGITNQVFFTTASIVI